MRLALSRLILLLLLTFSAGAKDTPYVILVSLDGFRWDYATRGITPNLDIIKQEGVWALSLKPSFPTSTFPNHISIITGMYPQNHGIILNYFKNHQGEIYSLGREEAVRDAKWYRGEAFWETAKRHNIRTASYYWPGSEVADTNRRPDYVEAYNHGEPHQDKIDGIIKWLSLPYSERPKFINLYFHDTDSKGHSDGPVSSVIDSTIAVVDSLIGVLRHRIEQIGMKDSINLIIVSDHGMAAVIEDKEIHFKEMLGDIELDVNEMSSFMMINPKNTNDLEKVYEILKRNEKNYKVYYRNEMPSYYNFSVNPYIYPIIIVPEVGWSVHYGPKRYHGTKGNHGYDNHHTDMHGIFFAVGNKFKSKYSVGSMNNIDIYPLLCEIFGINPRSNIDGDLDRIKFILK